MELKQGFRLESEARHFNGDVVQIHQLEVMHLKLNKQKITFVALAKYNNKWTFKGGLYVTFFKEYDRCASGMAGSAIDTNGFAYYPELEGKLPLVFSLKPLNV